MKNEIEIQLLLNNAIEQMKIQLEGMERPSVPIACLYHCFEDDQNIYLLMEQCEG